MFDLSLRFLRGHGRFVGVPGLGSPAETIFRTGLGSALGVGYERNMARLLAARVIRGKPSRLRYFGACESPMVNVLNILNFALLSFCQRVCKLEVFDEFEEWHMIQGHYAINMAV